MLGNTQFIMKLKIRGILVQNIGFRVNEGLLEGNREKLRGAKSKMKIIAFWRY